MKTSCILRAVALASLTVPVSAQLSGALDFDFIRVNDAGNPLNPGINYSWFPSSEFAVEATGIAVADVNNDSHLDVMFGAIEARPSHLYIANGDGTFTESAAAYGVEELSVRRSNHLFFDYDNDGDLDLASFGYPGYPYINLDLFSFYRNDGAPGYGFTDVTSGVGGFLLGPSSETTTVGVAGGAAAGDYDNDGYVDMIATYWYKNSVALGWDRDQFRLWHSVPNPTPFRGQPDYSTRLFTDTTQAAGLDGLGYGWIWHPSFTDIDRDGDLDLHINVETNEDLLLLNNGDGTFAPDIATSVGMNFNCCGAPFNPGASGGNEMGVGAEDVDNDGDLDYYLTNAGFLAANKKDAFYRNDTDLSEGGSGLGFTYVGDTTVAFGSDDPGWGIVFPDVDNDGDKDLVTARGMGIGMIGRNYVWRNLYPATSGAHGMVDFEDVTPFLATNGLGSCYDAARSLVSFDYDEDGDLDLLFSRSGDSPPHPADKLDATLYRNECSNGANWVAFDLVELGGSLNTIGARVFVRTGGVSGTVQMREVRCGSSFLAQEPSRLHFGLGSASEADYVVVRWFDGGMTVLTASDSDLSGVVQIQRAASVAGDLDGDAAVTDSDLQLFVQALANPATVDGMVAGDWPWRHTADLDGNGIVDRRDFQGLRPLVAATWADLGAGLAGTGGLVPALAGTGTLVGGTSFSLELSDAKPGSSAWVLLGFDLIVLPFKGGLLVPSLEFPPLGPVPVDGAGNLSLPATWPVGVPAGVLTQYQVWVVDPGAIVGLAASNALSSITP